MQKKTNKSTKVLWLVAVAMLAVALAASFVVWHERLSAEKDYKQVQMIVNMDDIQALANANNLTESQVAEDLAARGVSVVLFKERSLNDLERMGKVVLAMGDNVKSVPALAMVADNMRTNDANLYVVILDEAWQSQIVEHLSYKFPAAIFYEDLPNVIALPTMIASSATELNSVLTTLGDYGVGWDKQAMETMADLGLAVLPQMRSWSAPTDASLRFMVGEVKAMPNLYALLFNDKELPGASNTESLRSLAVLLKTDNVATFPVATIEFNEQKGLTTLGKLMDKNVVRLHTISNGEMSKFEASGGVDAAMDRWLLAAKERNMRALLVRFFDIDTPWLSYAKNMQYVETLHSGLVDSGFSVGGSDYVKPANVGTSQAVILLVGLGVAAGMLMLLLLLGFRALAAAIAVAVLGCWVGLYFVSPILARKLMALAAVVIYPTIGCISMMKPYPCKLAQSIARVVVMSLISFFGAILMVGLLGDVSFMLKLDAFVGVKVAHLIPLAVVPFILYIWYAQKPLEQVKDILAMAVTYKWALLGMVLAVCGFIYISRTGNVSTDISTLESTMRTTLNDVLGVRPRSKEFLIGYPFAVLLFYLGASQKYWVLTLPAIIGQVSLVNTYAHIHTPLLISLHRSLNGLALGLILGVLLTLAVRLAIVLWRKWVHE